MSVALPAEPSGTVNIAPEMLPRIEALLSANCRRYIGRGPSRISVRIAGDLIVVRGQGVLTQLETTFAKDPKNHQLIREFRKNLLRLAYPHWRAEFRKHFNLDVLELQGDWDVGNDRDVVVLRVAAI